MSTLEEIDWEKCSPLIPLDPLQTMHHVWSCESNDSRRKICAINKF